MLDRADGGPSACDEGAWDFSRVEEVWRQLAPLGPRAKDAKDARKVLADRVAIEALYDLTEAASAGIARLDGAGRDMLSHRLARVPRLPDSLGAGSCLEAIDVFLVKKFLFNYRAVLGLLDGETRARFSLGFESEALAASLGLGGSGDESFFVADAYDEGLAAVRGRIRALDDRIAGLRRASEESARLERGLDFQGRAFVVVPCDSAPSLLACEGDLRFSIEPQDALSCVARILPGEEELRAQAEREGLLGEEGRLEAAVLERLSIEIGAEAARLARYEDALCEFDLARARAVLAGALRLSRPRLGEGRLAIARGRLLPCEADCARLSLAYRPLDLALEERSALVFGSNMGGKTVALQTALSLQILAQAGLFVPAEGFETEVYGRIVYAGAPGPGRPEPGAAGDGLSGFGREVEALEGAWRAAREGGAFVVLDELGRTTSSPEAEAIVAAAAEAFAAAPGTRCLLATHFRGAAPSGRVARFRMAGLDRAAARAAAADPGLSLAERLRIIGGLMRYELIREGPATRVAQAGAASDALEVAALLGLDEAILSGARAYYSADRGPIEGDQG